MVEDPAGAFVDPPDPGRAGSLDDLAEQLRALKVWAGDPSYEQIKDRVNAALTAAGVPRSELTGKTTVVDCFRAGRRRLNTELVLAVVEALHPEPGYLAQWRQALRVVSGEAGAAAQVRVSDRLPEELSGFVGRDAELDVLRAQVRGSARTGDAVVISAIEGMAGVGKTQLAVRAGHLLVREGQFDRVLFVNLRGFHPDPAAQPPADPAAVLDGFLRLLGVPGQRVPHDLAARTAMFGDQLAGSRALVILDNAADEAQVRPLLTRTPGCLTLITSRRALAGLPATTRLTVDVFSPEEAIDFITRSASTVAVGDDPLAAARIARLCGYLPLALGLTAGHLRDRPGWTLTDHADRLDEWHRDRRLETGVELAVDLSYQHLPAGQQRVLRLAALHPGHDVDGYAAAALAGTGLDEATALLEQLHHHHMLQQVGPGRYTLHDLVRAFAAARASDEDRRSERQAALTRLFDFYLATAAAAITVLVPADAANRPAVAEPTTPAPVLTDLDAAQAWLNHERPNLVAVATYSAARDWPAYVTRLSAILFRYLAAGHPADALTVHGLAHDAAERSGDLTTQATAATHLGVTYMALSQMESAARYFQQALRLYRQVDHPVGHARALGNLGVADEVLGRYAAALDPHTAALRLFRRVGERPGEARSLMCAGVVHEKLCQYEAAIDRYTQALALFRTLKEPAGEATALADLGLAEVRLGRYGEAAEHLEQALHRYRQLDHRFGEGWTLDGMGVLHTCTARYDDAEACHRQAVEIHRQTGDIQGVASALNGLGEAAQARGAAAEALERHTEAHDTAEGIDNRYEQARACTGMGRAHHTLGDPASARRRYTEALALYRELGIPRADDISARLVALDAAASR